MRSLRGIPRIAMRQSMLLWEPDGNGGFSGPGSVPCVRWQRSDEAEPAGSDASPAGKVYVNGTRNLGGWRLKPGCRLEIGGEALRVSKVASLNDVSGRVHHWELDVVRDGGGWL